MLHFIYDRNFSEKKMKCHPFKAQVRCLLKVCAISECDLVSDSLCDENSRYKYSKSGSPYIMTSELMDDGNSRTRRQIINT